MPQGERATSTACGWKPEVFLLQEENYMLQTHQGRMLLKGFRRPTKKEPFSSENPIKLVSIPQTESMETPCRPVTRSQTGTIVHPRDQLRF